MAAASATDDDTCCLLSRSPQLVELNVPELSQRLAVRAALMGETGAPLFKVPTYLPTDRSPSRWREGGRSEHTTEEEGRGGWRRMDDDDDDDDDDDVGDGW